MALRTLRLTLLACCLLAVARSGLAPAQTESSGGRQPVATGILRATTTLVEVDVVVRNKQGRAVRDLKQGDFELYDEGKPQRIQLFKTPPEGALPSAGGGVATPALSVAAPQSPSETYTNRKPSGTERGGITIILIDPLDMWCQEWPRNRAGIIKFLRHARPGDRIGIYVMHWSGVSILRDITQDSAGLIKRLASWNGDPGQENHACTIAGLTNVAAGFGSLLSGPPSPMQQAAGMRNPNDTNFLSAGDAGPDPSIRKLKLFEAIAHHLAAVPGRKNVIWISDGFPISGFRLSNTVLVRRVEAYDYGREEEKTMQAMNQANVAIYSFDAGWLRAPVGTRAFDPTSPSVPVAPPEVVASTPGHPAIAEQMAQTRFVGELAMREISYDTGGRAYVNTNDMVGSLRNAYDDSRAAYTLGFYPEEPAFKGGFHNLKVKVKDRPDLRLYYRKGYADVPAADSIKAELEAAAWSPFDESGIGLTARLTNAGRRRPVLNVNIALGGLSLKHTGDRWRGTVDVALVQKDDQGRQYNSVDQTISLALRPETYRKLLKSGFGFHESVPMNAETTSLRVIVVDDASHNLGSLTIPVTSPN